MLDVDISLYCTVFLTKTDLKSNLLCSQIYIRASPTSYVRRRRPLPVLSMSPCQDGIKPMWEDERNKLGGRWLMTLSKQQRHNDLDRFWMETVS